MIRKVLERHLAVSQVVDGDFEADADEAVDAADAAVDNRSDQNRE
jgi:hypothetical protein